MTQGTQRISSTTPPPHNAPVDRDAALRRLHHEMTALLLMMPATLPGTAAMTAFPAATRRSDAEIEAQFDNMPV